MLGVLLNGIAIGIIVAAPVGPVNLICVQRTLAAGPASGMIAGLGAVAGDALFAVLAAGGLVAAGDLTGGLQAGMAGLGAAILLVLGMRTYFRATPDARDAARRSGPATPGWRTAVTTFALTVTNPATFLGFIAIFAGAGGLVAAERGPGEAAMIVAGVAAGSALWWLVLTQTVGLARKGLGFRLIRRLNQVSGLLIAAFGLWLAWRAGVEAGLW